MNKMLIVVGVVIVVAGLAWPWLVKLPLFRLPGDIVIDRPGFKLYFPVVTMLLISGGVSLILWLLRR
jgi:hypothetical protein